MNPWKKKNVTFIKVGANLSQIVLCYQLQKKQKKTKKSVGKLFLISPWRSLKLRESSLVRSRGHCVCLEENFQLGIVIFAI